MDLGSDSIGSSPVRFSSHYTSPISDQYSYNKLESRMSDSNTGGYGQEPSARFQYSTSQHDQGNPSLTTIPAPPLHTFQPVASVQMDYGLNSSPFPGNYASFSNSLSSPSFSNGANGHILNSNFGLDVLQSPAPESHVYYPAFTPQPVTYSAHIGHVIPVSSSPLVYNPAMDPSFDPTLDPIFDLPLPPVSSSDHGLNDMYSIEGAGLGTGPTPYGTLPSSDGQSSFNHEFVETYDPNESINNVVDIQLGPRILSSDPINTTQQYHSEENSLSSSMVTPPMSSGSAKEEDITNISNRDEDSSCSMDTNEAPSNNTQSCSNKAATGPFSFMSTSSSHKYPPKVEKKKKSNNSGNSTSGKSLHTFFGKKDVISRKIPDASKPKVLVGKRIGGKKGKSFVLIFKMKSAMLEQVQNSLKTKVDTSKQQSLESAMIVTISMEKERLKSLTSGSPALKRSYTKPDKPPQILLSASPRLPILAHSSNSTTSTFQANVVNITKTIQDSNTPSIEVKPVEITSFQDTANAVDLTQTSIQAFTAATPKKTKTVPPKSSGVGSLHAFLGLPPPAPPPIAVPVAAPEPETVPNTEAPVSPAPKSVSVSTSSADNSKPVSLASLLGVKREKKKHLVVLKLHPKKLEAIVVKPSNKPSAAKPASNKPIHPFFLKHVRPKSKCFHFFSSQ